MSNVTLIDTRSPRSALSVIRSLPAVVADSALEGPTTVSREVTLPTGQPRPERLHVEPKERAEALKVSRMPSGYWQDREWLRVGDMYLGNFAANGRQWPGQITWDPFGLRRCLILYPPEELWKHPHARCFSHVGNSYYSVHFARRPDTIDAAIVAVETILSEATAVPLG